MTSKYEPLCLLQVKITPLSRGDRMQAKRWLLAFRSYHRKRFAAARLTFTHRAVLLVIDRSGNQDLRIGAPGGFRTREYRFCRPAR
jgi:hypothetical protein